MAVGSDIKIKVIVEENTIDMAQGGLLMEVKHLQGGNNPDWHIK